MNVLNHKFITYLIISIIVFGYGCIEKNKIIIRRDYVINPYWNEQRNDFSVIRMKSIDDTNLDPENATYSDLQSKLLKDTSFIYRAEVKYNGINYSKRKVYFNKDNGFLWRNRLHKSKDTKRNLGGLQVETWYLLTGLGRQKTLYYIYVDKTNRLHKIRVPASSWTNI